ncbi:MAG TPA: alpha/beta hydrolase [Sphingomicrobium sp.]|nr:alpha/beta hydrolase [Sphingomicrobium sp.]
MPFDPGQLKPYRRRFTAGACVVIAYVAAAGCTPLTAFNALVPKDQGVELVARDVPYGADPRQRLDVYRPRGRGGESLPVIVFFYGGSWNSGTKSGYSFVGRALASRGFVIAIPDYRLVPKVRYPAFLEDGAAAVHWIVGNGSHLGADPSRIIIAGHSAGAYNGAMLAYDPRWLGPDLRYVKGFVGLAGPYDFLPFSGEVTRAAFKGTSDLPSTQPVNFVRKGAPPALLLTGALDRIVLPRNSDRLAERLRAVGSPVVRKNYANLGHVGVLTAIARPLRRRAGILDDMIAFAREATTVKG